MSSAANSEAKSTSSNVVPVDLGFSTGAGNRGFINNFTGRGSLNADQSAGGTNAGMNWTMVGLIIVGLFILYKLIFKS